jgi:hypothetical protein
MIEELGANMPPIQTQTPLVGVNTVVPAPSSVDGGPPPNTIQPEPSTPNPVAEAFTEDKAIRQQEDDIINQLDQEPDPDAIQEDPSPPTLNAVGEVLVNPLDAAQTAFDAATSWMVPKEFTPGYRSFTDIGSLDKIPPENVVNNLRTHQSDPEVVELFDKEFGPGSSKRYLSLPSESHMFNLWLSRNDPDVVKEFDKIYGGTSALALRLMDPARSEYTKAQDKQELIKVLALGQRTIGGRTGVVKETIDAVTTGSAKTGQEIVRFGMSIADLLAGGDSNVSKQIDFGAGSNVGTQYPAINDMITTISQALTGRVAIGGKAGGFIKELGIGALVDGIAFNPDDPNLGDLFKRAGLPAPTAADFESEMAKRALNAGYGAVAGTVVAGAFKALGGLFRSKTPQEAAKHIDDFRAKVKGAQEAPVKPVEAPVGPKAVEVPPGAKPGSQALPEAPKALPEVRAADTAGMPQRDALKAIITDTPPGAVAYDNAIKGAASDGFVPNSVIRILDDMPKFETLSIKQMDEAVSDVFDRWLNVAGKSVDEIMDVFNAPAILDYVPKIQQLAIATYRQGVRNLTAAKEALDAAKDLKVTNADKLTELDTAQDMAAKLLEKYSKVNEAASLFSGRNLALRQTSENVRKALRQPIEDAMKRGATPDEIADLAMRVESTLNKEGLHRVLRQINSINKQIDEAVSSSQVEKLLVKKAELEKTLESIQNTMTKEATTSFSAGLQKVGSIIRQVIKDVITLTTNAMLSGLGTIKRNVLGGVIHRTAVNVSTFLGQVTKELTLTNLATLQLNKIAQGGVEGFNMYRMLRDARSYGIRAGTDSAYKTFKGALKDAAVASWKNTPGQARSIMDTANIRINAGNYGLKDDNALGRVINVFGKGVDLMTLGMRFSDEVMTNIYNISARAEYSAFEFAEKALKRAELVQAKLRDPRLRPETVARLKDELRTLKGSKATVDGLTLKEFVERDVLASKDKLGRWVHEKSAERAEYILLKNDLEGVWKKAEIAINSNPEARIMVPFFRSPVQGFLRGFEYVPVLRNIPGLSKFRNQLKSADPLVAAEARGKMFLGYGIMLGIWQMYENDMVGEFIGAGEREKRQAKQAAGGLQPNYVDIGGGRVIDTTGLDPVSIPFALVGALHGSIKRMERDRMIEAERQATGLKNQSLLGPIAEHTPDAYQMAGAFAGAIASALGVAAVNNPAFTFVKDIVDLGGAFFGEDKANVLKDQSAKQKSLSRILRNQAGKFVPALYKNYRDFNDPQLYEQTYALSELLDAFKNEASLNREDMSMKYDAMGYPIQRAIDPRGVAGPINTMRPTSDDPKVLEVRQALYDLGKLTGKGFVIFNDQVPDKFLRAAGTDLRRLDSTEKRHVIDTFAKELQKTGLMDALHQALVVEKDKLKENGLGLGGPVKSARLEAVRNLITKAREQAWAATLKKEGLLEEGTGVIPGGNKKLQEERSYGGSAILRDELN